MKIEESLSFDDVLLVPKYSEIASRAEVDLTVNLSKDFKFNLPFVPSNMKTISELAMVKEMVFGWNALGVFHRFTDMKTQLEWLEKAKGWGRDSLRYTGFSVGVKEQDYKNVDIFVAAGAQILVVDVAHGNSKNCIDMTKYIAEKYPDILLIAGNVADDYGAVNLWQAGADVVKVSVGSGSICLTRINTGNGVSSFTSLTSCYEVKARCEEKLGRKLYLMQDGGLHSAGCFGKALCFADLCMAGNVFSATDEAPGEILEINEVKYKSYVGSSTHRGAHSEGVEALKKYKGPVAKVIKELCEGIRSCCSYQGMRNLQDLKINPIFRKITAAGIRESKAHDLDMVIR
jgi:IMP dehydrogenase